MALNSIGDLARGYTLKSRSTAIKQEIETLSHELSSGQVSDLSARLRGDYSQIAAIDSSLERLDGFRVATAEAGLIASGMQKSLSVINDSVSDLSAALLSFGSSNQTVTYEQASVQAQNDLDAVLSALNTRIGGRSLFAGMATDTTPMESTETLLTALRAEISGLTIAADAQQAAQDWFDDPAGFHTTMYRGSDTSLASMRLSDDDQVNLRAKADDDVYRDVLGAMALAALAFDPALDLPPDQRAELLTSMGVELANSKDSVLNVRAEIGAAEARVEQAQTRNSATRTSLEFSRGGLIGADPYETATRLQEVQYQLEALYSVTVRNANLSLVNFLR